MIHIFEKGTKEQTLLLLHGTGGDEYDLIPLAKMINSQVNILSVRGNVIENGMNRFFRRISEGVFDETDLMSRTDELYSFLKKASREYQFDLNKVIAFGYSNGANIIANMLYSIPNSLQYAILSHPMVPRRQVNLLGLTKVKVFIGAGENDPLVPKFDTSELGDMLSRNNADVEFYWNQNGHRLSQEELFEIIKWYQKLFI